MAESNTEKYIPKESQIKKSGFNQFMSRLFGWQRTRGKSASNSGIEFSKVDVDSNERVGQAIINEINNIGPMSDKLEKLFQSWLNDNTDKLIEIADRKNRIDQLQYMVLNDPYVNRTVALYADEATQLDEQNTIISIETPDPRMTKKMYSLINTWGLTQNRIRATIEQLAIYGDAFWSNKVTERGVERIKPLQQMQVTDRIEFNPIKALEAKKRREGTFYNMQSNNYLINQMLDSMEETGDFSDMFDTKLFGFSIDQDLTVTPWAITHFRVNSDGSEFYPFGTSPILGALSPFKQTQSTITLQSLARVTSFPITIFKVKTSESMDEGRQFGVVNRVRESFDNIGVNPSVGGSEVYTANTRIWIPDGLVTVETVSPGQSNSGDNVNDIALYQDRTAVALGIPKSFFSEEWYGMGNSGKSLVQQYKPFGRKVYSLQSAFLEGLANLFRIHFAITGEYDFRIPFTLSMKFPAVEVDDDYNNARNNSLEVAENVINLVKSAIGAEEDEGLPADITRDIISKYTFLDPTDIIKWTRDAKVSAGSVDIEGASYEGGDSNFMVGGPEGGMDIDEEGGEESGEVINLDDMGGGESSDSEMSSSDEGVAIESRHNNMYRLREERRKKIREKYLKDRYNEKKGELYFESLQENAVNAFVRNGNHVQVFNISDDTCNLMYETLSKNNSNSIHLHEYEENI